MKGIEPIKGSNLNHSFATFCQHILLCGRSSNASESKHCKATQPNLQRTCQPNSLGKWNTSRSHATQAKQISHFCFRNLTCDSNIFKLWGFLTCVRACSFISCFQGIFCREAPRQKHLGDARREDLLQKGASAASWKSHKRLEEDDWQLANPYRKLIRIKRGHIKLQYNIQRECFGRERVDFNTCNTLKHALCTSFHAFRFIMSWKWQCANGLLQILLWY